MDKADALIASLTRRGMLWEASVVRGLRDERDELRKPRGGGLTARQKEAFDFIKSEIEAGLSPSYDEIQAELGLSSKSIVSKLVAALEERGRIRRIPARARSITLV